MPTYEYSCNACGKKFTLVMGIAAHEKKPEKRCDRLLLPHFGHFGRFRSCSAIPMVSENFFEHALQEYS